MINNTIYSVQKEATFNAEQMVTEELISNSPFNALTTESLEKRKMGFVPNLVSGQYVDKISVKENSFIVVTIREQKKTPEKYMIDQLINVEKVKYLADTGEEPSKGLLKEWKESATDAVTTKTPPKKPKDYVVAIRNDGLIFVEAKGKLVEDLTALVRKAVGTFPVVPFEPETPISDFMDEFVGKGKKDIFTLGGKAKLVDPMEVTYTIAKGSLYDTDASSYVNDSEMRVESVELDYDGMVSFTLKDTFVLESVKFDKERFESDESEAGSFFLKLEEMNKLVKELISRTLEEE